MAIKAAPKGEIAVAKINPFEPLFNNIMQPHDATLATRGGGKGIWIYDEIERDCHAFAVLQKRKYAITGREWHLDPASDAARDKRAAEGIEAMLRALPFDRICTDLLDAILKGYAVSEIIWGIVDGQVVPLDIRPRDQRRFAFDAESQPRLLTTAHLLTGEALPARKFIVHRFGAKDGNPYGLGLGTRLFWPVWFKRQGIQFWLTFADKFGNPTPVGRYPGGDKEKRDELLNILYAIANDTGIALPEGLEIELLEAKRSGGANDVYDALLKYLDDEIEKAVLGTTQTTSSRSGGGMNSNVSAVQNEVRLELVRADSDLLADTLNHSLVRWLTEFNYAAARPPRLYWDVEEGEDLKLCAERDQILAQIGYKLTPDAVVQIYGDFYEPVKPSQPPVNAPPLKPGASADPNAPAFAEIDPTPDTVTQIADAMERAAAAPLEQWIAQLRAIVDASPSLEALRDRLLVSFSELPTEELAKVMQAGFAIADLAGRYDVHQAAQDG